MKTSRSIAAACALMAACAFAPQVAHARTVAAEDLFALRLLDGAQLSPDGKHAVVVESRLDGPKNTYDTTVLLVDVSSGRSSDATHGTTDGNLAWSPDSRSFYFVRSAPKKPPQIFRYTLATQRIERVSNVKDGATGPVPSNDGKRIAFTVVATDTPHATYIDFAKAGFKPGKDEKTSDIRTIPTMHFEVNGAGYVYNKHAHIWVMNADGSGAHALTSGEYSENGPAWSYDDKTILFGSLRYESPSQGPSDIYAIPAGGGAMRKLSSNMPANYLAFVSRSSDTLWYAAADIGDPGTYPALRSARFDGSDMHEIVAKDQVSFGDSLLADLKEGGGACGDVTPGDRTAVVNVDGPGYSNLRTLDMQTGTLRDLTPAHGEAWSCSLSKDGKTVAYLYSDFTHPGELFVADTETGKARRLTHANDAYLHGVTLSNPEPFVVKDSAGFDVYAWFMPATTPGTKHPTLLDIHGGPQTQFGDTYFDEFQLWTSLGYNVVFSDPRGSVGFGHAFEAALNKNWGNAMFDDVQAVMDQAVKRPDVDASRMAVLGGSYGGYATLWVISHTDRYKTAIAERAVSDLQSESFAADFASDDGLGGFYQWGKPWDPASLYASMSPLTYVNDVHTPLMILHSENDTRTPIDQTLQEFNLLKILGRTVTYIDVPGENHDLNRTGSPIHRVERLNLMADWLKKYLQP
ncbi:MAG TPA: S9 family peptidase [Candidatus Baltobacteraceae bacterium]|nr:S9 family peptidase [Candidatus Baltobacteraceae bacterium]